MEALYYWLHNALGICFYVIPAIIVGLIILIICLVHGRNQKKRQDEFEEDMERRYSNNMDTSAVEEAPKAAEAPRATVAVAGEVR